MLFWLVLFKQPINLIPHFNHFSYSVITFWAVICTCSNLPRVRFQTTEDSPYVMEPISESHSIMADSLWPHGLYSPRNSPGQNTGVGSLSLLLGIFPAQGSNSGLPHCRQILYQLSHKGGLMTFSNGAHGPIQIMDSNGAHEPIQIRKPTRKSRNLANLILCVIGELPPPTPVCSFPVPRHYFLCGPEWQPSLLLSCK